MASNAPKIESDNVRPIVTQGAGQAAELQPQNCTVVAIVPRWILDHPIAKLDNGDLVVIVPAVFPVANRLDGRQDPTKFPDAALAGAHTRADVAEAFKGVGVTPYGAV